jgi:hypothetical protein
MIWLTNPRESMQQDHEKRTFCRSRRASGWEGRDLMQQKQG